jgi:hypothetical protein
MTLVFALIGPRNTVVLGVAQATHAQRSVTAI